MKRMDLYMNFDRPLDETELARYRELVSRRGDREPLQHLVGETPFRELSLRTDRRALIPRQETELIVDLARKALAPGRRNLVLDVGVGAGPIYLSLLRSCPATASSEWTRPTRRWPSPARTRSGTGSSPRTSTGATSSPPCRLISSSNLIVANPPYIGEREDPSLQPEVRDHDPRQALIGGPEGWELPARLMNEAFARIAEGGALIMEIGAGQFPLLKEKSRSRPWSSCDRRLGLPRRRTLPILHK